MQKSNNLNELFAALAKAQAEMRAVPFDSKNPHFNNKFASLTAIQEATRPILAKHGLCITQILSSEENHWLHTLLGHSSGQYIQSSIKLIMVRNDMQSLGSANTYARRYAWQNIIGIAGDEDDDAEAATGRSKPATISASRGPSAGSGSQPSSAITSPGVKNQAPADKAQFARIAHLLEVRGIGNDVFQKYLKEIHGGVNSKTMKYFHGVSLLETLEREDCTEAMLMAEIAQKLNIELATAALERRTGHESFATSKDRKDFTAD